MQSIRWTQVMGAVGLCLLSTLFVRLAGGRAAPSAHYPADAPPAPRSESDWALREALGRFVRAQMAVNREREELEAWDPAGTESLDAEVWRKQLMATDRSGELRRALDAARQAAALARTPREEYRAAAFLARLECEAGHHEAEWEPARRLMALAPRNWLSRLCLRHTVECNGLKAPLIPRP